MNEPLKDRVALVTGASRGIGLAVAMELGRHGADVVLAARNPGPAEGAVSELKAMGRKAMTLPLDVSVYEDVAGVLEPINKAMGKVSILVNNAGITRDQLLVRMKPEDWTEVLRVNLDGTFFCTKIFSRDMMRARWGRIINISSVVAVLGNPGQANYAASKAGILGLTRSVSRELAGRGVTVNAVAPGYIDTAMTAGLPEAARDSLLGSIPLGRLGTSEDVAGVVAFLASDHAAYITGQVIHVDGGMVMT